MILLKFEKEIKGSSNAGGHAGWINIESMQLGVGRSIASSGGNTKRSTSNPSFSEFTLTKATDIASADLYFQAVGGDSLGKATIHLVEMEGTDKEPQVYLEYELHDAIISSYSISSNGEHPNESFSINFTKIVKRYDHYDGKKKIAGTPKKWDLTKNGPF